MAWMEAAGRGSVRRFSAWAALPVILLAACSAAPSSSVESGSDEDLGARARGIHARVMTLDTHVDIPGHFATPEADPGVRGSSQVDLPKMREGGLDTAFFIVYVGQTARTPDNQAGARAAAQQKFDAIFRMTRTYPERIVLACRSTEVEALHEGGRLVAMIGVENGYPIGRDLGLLADYHAQCARYFGLVHNGHNDIADSAQPSAARGEPQEEHGGLSAFGEEVVRELNRLGIMVDVSHASKKSMLHAVRVSRAPIIASHSGASAVNPHVRNLDDEQLLAIRENGGVVQAVALSDFVKTPAPERNPAIAVLRKEFGLTSDAAADTLAPDARAAFIERRAMIDFQWPPASVADFVNHIDHIVRVAGIDHVGIASDFDGGGGVAGWNDASQTFNVTLELVRRGYTEQEIRKIWGGNLLRVWREVEALAEPRGDAGR